MQSFKKLSVVKSTALSLLMIVGAGTSAGHAATIAHWTLQEAAAGTTATGPIIDASGNGHNGTIIGDPQYSTLPGGDIGLDFSGNNDQIRVEDSAAFEVNSMTVEALVQVQSFGSLRQIVFRGDSQGSLDPFFLAVDGTNLRWLITGLGGAIAALNFDITSFLNEEIHVAGTIDDGTGAMNLFVNGTQVATQNTGVRPIFPLPPLPGGCGISIGMLHDCANNGQYFDGLIGEVRISDMALNPNQFLGAPTAVPLPAALPLLAGGLGLFGFMGWRRKRKTSPAQKF